MGTLGDSIQLTVDNLVDNVNFKTPIIIRRRAPTSGVYGGYGAVSDNVSLEETVNSVPYNLVSADIELHQSGPLSPGEVRMIFRGDVELDSAAEVEFNSKVWEVRNIEPIIFNNVVVAVVATFGSQL